MISMAEHNTQMIFIKFVMMYIYVWLHFLFSGYLGLGLS